MSFEQVILSCLNKIITRLNDLLSVSQLTETSRNVPKRTRTDRNGPKRTYKTTETDFNGYPAKRTLQCTETEQNVVSAHRETNTMGTKVGQVMVENKCMCVVEVGR